MLVELYTQTLTNLLESQGMQSPTQLDAGKWYQAKLNKLDNE
jgi:hypothetical protein